MFDKMLFAKTLKEIRESKMTREEFAEKLGMSERNVARIESGERLTTLPTFYEICNILEVGPDQLHNTYTKATTFENSSSTFDQLIQKLCEMDSKDLALVLEIVQSLEKYR
ncbi:MAG: helix-turn-helix domain-containing protein [Lachnospiraceae bacterium]